MIRLQNRGFTIVELLIVIVVIGILVAIVVVAYMGITNQARESKLSADLRNIKQGISRLELNTGGVVFGCPSRTFGPEGSVNNANSGLVSQPTGGTVNETCTWSSSAVSDWKGPYFQLSNDPWGRSYYVDLDYYICDGGNGRLIAAAVSFGADGSLQYPTTANTGACTTNSSDDLYLELWR